MKTYNSSLELKHKEDLIKLLNQQLADTFDVFSQVKQAHWNVKGMQFYALHTFFDTLAGELLGYVDMIAERATALGGVAQGTVRMAATASTIPQSPDTFDNCEFTVKKVTGNFQSLSISSRNCIDIAEKLGDKATADLFTEITRGIDKSIYMLDAHLN